MFEYFDFEVLKASIVMVIILLLMELSRSQKNKRRDILIYVSFYKTSSAQSNKDAFKDNLTLQCHEAISDYCVSKSDG